MDFVHFQKLCQLEARRSLLVMGFLVGIILILQSSTLPYGNVLWSLFPSSISSLLGGNKAPTENSSSNTLMVRNQVNESSRDKISALVGNSSALENAKTPDDASTLEMAIAPEAGHTLMHVINELDGNSSVKSVQRSDSSLILEKVGISETKLSSIPPALPPTWSLNNITLLTKGEENSSASISSSVSPMEKQTIQTLSKDENPGLLHNDTVTPKNSHTMTHNPDFTNATTPTTSVSRMNNLLLQSRLFSHSLKPQWPSECDQELLFAKSQIENSPITKDDPQLYPHIFRNVSMFKRSFDMMERILKVYIYKEGEKPIFHEPTEPILKGIYASEGWFMKQMENNKHFVVEDPKKAHLFYMPFSSRMLQLTLYVRNSHKRGNLAVYLKNYVEMIASKHPFWNRTGGADHFLVACHDWAPFETRHHMDNCIKVLCNANIARDFKIGKDVTLPEAQVRRVEDPLRDLGGKPPAERQILAFFAGGMHGNLRPILLKYWKNDFDMKIFGQMPRDHKGMNYIQHMKSSKYCICAKGFDVHSPRVVESIFFECVPVFISDDYVPPFFEILDWEAFAVFVAEKDIPKLKDILLSIPKEKYLEMHLNVQKVQRHFLWHNEPVKYDIFHMILHSVWYNRLNQM